MRSTLLGVAAEVVEVDDTMNARCLRPALGPDRSSVFQVCSGTCQTAPLLSSVIVWPPGARMTPV